MLWLSIGYAAVVVFDSAVVSKRDNSGTCEPDASTFAQMHAELSALSFSRMTNDGCKGHVAD